MGAGKVLVLYNYSQHLVKGEPKDILAEHGVIACAHAVAAALREAGYTVEVVAFSTDIEAALAPYPPKEWVVFNLGEGLEGRLFEEARIAWALEAMGYRFTGSPGEAIALSTNKAKAKEALARAGVPTPPWKLLRDPAEVDGWQPDGPLIVKPVSEDASIGIGASSVVTDPHQLRERVAYILNRYRQAALAEKFISGREFNISLWGSEPEILPLAEVDFSAFANPLERIVSFAAKWEPDSFEYKNTPVICPAVVDPELKGRIEEVAKKAWHAIGCRGYARVDMRVDTEGNPYVVEINCNPDLSPDAGFYRAARAAGYTYTEMVVRILRLAVEGV
jgi:D-alanine-D-alanine ligase